MRNIMKKYRSSRRSFLGFCGSIPLIGLPFQRLSKTRLQEIVASAENPKIMVLFHDYESALQIVPHLGLRGVAISMYGTSQFVHPGTVPSVCFYQSRPKAWGGDQLDPINGDAYREARLCHIILGQHSRKYGTFTVIKSRFTPHGEKLNVFTPKRKPAVSNVQRNVGTHS